VADNGVYSMEASLAKVGVRCKLSPRNPAMAFVGRAMSKLGLVRALARVGQTAYLVPGDQGADWRCFPVTYSHEVVPWMFDAWPNLYGKIERMLRRQRVRLAFCSARQSAEHLTRKLGIECVWLPEACDATLFNPSKRLAERTIDVLELGRKYDAWHEAVTDRLATLGKVHLYERVRGQMIFGTEQAMRAGYGDAKVSISFPSSLTHPARSGNVETVTLRYFESMAAKCLIVGHCPAELKDIMGYNPVVEADMSSAESAAGQIEEILANVDRHQEQVERNYRAVLERGVWDVRIRELLDELAKRGYEADIGRSRGV
jgi:hypothetical protein